MRQTAATCIRMSCCADRNLAEGNLLQWGSTCTSMFEVHQDFDTSLDSEVCLHLVDCLR